MSSINDVCEALAEAVGQIPGLRAVGYIDDQINPPQAQVYTREYDPRMVLGNSKRAYMLGVRVFVRRTNPRSAQLALRDYMESSGSTSIPAAIEDESNWSATVDYAEVTSIGQPFEVETAAEVFWAVDFDVDVIY